MKLNTHFSGHAVSLRGGMRRRLIAEKRIYRDEILKSAAPASPPREKRKPRGTRSHYQQLPSNCLNDTKGRKAAKKSAVNDNEPLSPAIVRLKSTFSAVPGGSFRGDAAQ